MTPQRAKELRQRASAENDQGLEECLDRIQELEAALVFFTEGEGSLYDGWKPEELLAEYRAHVG